MLYDPEAFERDGYIIRKQFLTERETTALRRYAQDKLDEDRRAGTVMEKGDATGNTTLLKMWNEAGDDPFGLAARDERLVNLTESLLGEPIYLYSHKMTMKEPGVGGAWEWHQDYGYWYNYGCLAPDMLSIFVALDPATRENGCLQVLKGTHKLGRLDHVRENEQTKVEKEALSAARERFEHVYVVLDAGDALIFHCNLLHGSDANTSDKPRWGFICSYNTVENAPYKRVRDYGNYSELKVVPAGSMMDALQNA